MRYPEVLFGDVLFAKFKYKNSFRTAKVQVSNFRYNLEKKLIGCVVYLIKEKRQIYRNIRSIKFFRKKGIDKI